MFKHEGRHVGLARIRAAKAAGLAWIIAALAAAATAAEVQTDASPRVLAASSGAGQVLVMPLAADAIGSVVLGGVRIDMVVEEGYRVYRAKHRGRTHTARTALSGPSGRLAFDVERGRFSEVAPTLRLRLTDDALLDRIVADTGAIGGKAYPALGWALLELPRQVNPAAVAQALRANPGVISAHVQLRSSIRVPL